MVRITPQNVVSGTSANLYGRQTRPGVKPFDPFAKAQTLRGRRPEDRKTTLDTQTVERGVFNAGEGVYKAGKKEGTGYRGKQPHHWDPETQYAIVGHPDGGKVQGGKIDKTPKKSNYAAPMGTRRGVNPFAVKTKAKVRGRKD